MRAWKTPVGTLKAGILSEPSGPPPLNESPLLARAEDPGVYGVAMQFLRNAVFSAPTSFLDLASLRQAVRLACFAAASPVGGAAAGAGFAAAGGLVAGIAAAVGAAGAGAAVRRGGGAAGNAPPPGRAGAPAAAAGWKAGAQANRKTAPEKR